MSPAGGEFLLELENGVHRAGEDAQSGGVDPGEGEVRGDRFTWTVTLAFQTGNRKSTAGEVSVKEVFAEVEVPLLAEGRSS